MTATPNRELDQAAERTVGLIASWPVAQLRPHPTLERLRITPSAQEISVAADGRTNPNRELVSVTQQGYVLAGQAQWEVAKRHGDVAIECMQLELSEDEALLWLIQKRQGAHRINSFTRILLALELESFLKDRARANQRLGGLMKGSSKMPEADKLDVRAEVAEIAGVSVGNVSKAKSLIPLADPAILEALRDGEVSIHKAFTWVQTPDGQREQLTLHQNRRGIKRAIRTLQSKHHGPKPTTGEFLDLTRLANALRAITAEAKATVAVGTIAVPGCSIVISSGLRKMLEIQGELAL